MPATSTDTRAAEAATRSFFAAYNAHKEQEMLAACSDDAQLRYVPMGDQGEGKVREVGKTIWSGLIDAFPDLTVTAQRVFSDGTNAAAEVMIGGTQKKDFLGIPNQGKRYDLPHAFLLTLNESGRITQITCYWDNASFYLQLGKTTLP